MDTPERLLQPSLNKDPRSIAFAKIVNRLADIDPAGLQVYNLENAPAAALPYLAEQFSVTGLEGLHWTTTSEEQRQLIRNAIPLHKLKGTLEGYKAICRLTGQAEITGYIAPPDIPYLAPETSQDEWARFLAQMPQIRTYRYRSKGSAGAIAFLNRFYPGDEPTGKYPAVSDAIQRYRERAFKRLPTGEEIELVVYDRDRTYESGLSTTIESIAENGKPHGTFALNHDDFVDEGLPRQFIGVRNNRGHGFLVDHNPDDRLYRLEFTEPYSASTDSWRKRLIAPGNEQLRVKYDLIREQGIAQGLFVGACYLAPSTAATPTEPPSVPPQPPIIRPSLNLGVSDIVYEPSI